MNITEDILDILLLDRTSEKNIIWATDNEFVSKTDYITKDNYHLIKSRIEKSKDEKKNRSKNKAEVFTPSWICNKQNNLIDNEWFGYSGAFNVEQYKTWLSTKKVNFKNKNWKDYVKSMRLEITCGEAPYLVSRYDATNGNQIELFSRIGLFDRKMRVICENANNDEEWLEQSLIALKSTYGYEFQGDNLFLARRNIFLSYIDYYFYRFNEIPKKEILVKIAEIISWNIWQMDGLKMVIPFSCHNDKIVGIFETKEEKCLGCQKNDMYKHNGIYSMIMNWETNTSGKFISLLREK